MNTQIMTEWLNSVDREMKSKKRKVLLFLDNAPCHPQAIALTNVTLAYLPPNCTALIQPMDQGIIQAVKMKYKKLQLRKILLLMEAQHDADATTILKRTSILDAINMVASAWKEISTDTIAGCWKRAGFTDATVNPTDSAVDEDEDNIPLAQLCRRAFGVEIEDINLDENVATCDNSTIDWSQDASTILNAINRTDNVDEAMLVDDSDGEDDVVPPSISTATAVSHCADLKAYAGGFYSLTFENSLLFK